MIVVCFVDSGFAIRKIGIIFAEALKRSLVFAKLEINGKSFCALALCFR